TGDALNEDGTRQSYSVDPGVRHVEVRGPTGIRARFELTLARGETEVRRVAVNAHVTQPVTPAPVTPAEVTPPVPAGRVPALSPSDVGSPPVAPETPTTSNAGPVSFIVVGALGGVATVAFWVLRETALSDCQVQGDVARCPTASLDGARMAPTWALAGDIALGVGSAALLTGVLWLVLRPHHDHGEHAGLDVGAGTL